MPVGKLVFNSVDAETCIKTIKGVERNDDFLVAFKRLICAPAVVVVNIIRVVRPAESRREIFPNLHYRRVDVLKKIAHKVGFQLQNVALVEFVICHFAKAACIGVAGGGGQQPVKLRTVQQFRPINSVDGTNDVGASIPVRNVDFKNRAVGSQFVER